MLDRGAARVTAAEKVGNEFHVTLTGYAGHGYQLQRSDAAVGAWTNVGVPQVGSGDSLMLSDHGGVTGSGRFYRVRIEP